MYVADSRLLKRRRNSSDFNFSKLRLKMFQKNIAVSKLSLKNICLFIDASHPSQKHSSYFQETVKIRIGSTIFRNPFVSYRSPWMDWIFFYFCQDVLRPSTNQSSMLFSYIMFLSYRSPWMDWVFFDLALDILRPNPNQRHPINPQAHIGNTCNTRYLHIHKHPQPPCPGVGVPPKDLQRYVHNVIYTRA